jgi:hypothetical protein
MTLANLISELNKLPFAYLDKEVFFNDAQATKVERVELGLYVLLLGSKK